MAGVLRPSSASRWRHCGGSHTLEPLYPEDTESFKAREGTAAHFYATETLQGRVVAVGDLAPNGHPIDADMVEGGQIFIADVTGEVRGLEGRCSYYVEAPVETGPLVNPECKGTPDTFMLAAQAKRLVVWDYKYGHRAVDPFGNEQLLCYLAGALNSLELTLAEVADWDISLRIVQPRDFRAEPVKRWDFKGSAIPGLLAPLQLAAVVALTPGALCVTGPWCNDCDAPHACDALRRAGGAAMDVSGEATPQELDPVAIGLELKRLETAAKRLEARRTGLEQVVMSKIMSGQPVPGWSMGASTPREKWNAPAADVNAVALALSGKSILKEPDLITPAQARKLGVDPMVTETYSYRPQGEPKLVMTGANTAAKAFGG